MDSPKIYLLANGIRLVHLPLKREVCHAGLIIDAGSGEEQELEHGLAHFIEHVLFKGTKKRKSFHILSRLDAVGGEINAYTTKEETWIVEAFLNEHFERAMELMADIVFNSTFPAHELEKEKEVVLDEINAYEDNPGDIIFDEFEEVLFRGHSLGRSILGVPEMVRGFNREKIFRFVERNYLPENMVVSIVGDIAPSRLIKVAERYFSDFRSSGSGTGRTSPEILAPSHVVKDKDTHQVHYVMGGMACSAKDDGRISTLLLNNILGGPALNSRLNMAVRERNGYAYHIESHYQPFHNAGYFQIYMGTDRRNFEKAKYLIMKELERLKNSLLTVTQLHMSKQQLIGQLAMSQDSGSNLMSNLGKSVQLNDKIDSGREIIEAIEKVNSNEILEMANRLFDSRNLNSVTYV